MMAIEKDKEGGRAMMQLARPKSDNTEEVNPEHVSWYEDKEVLQCMWSYCLDDVRTQKAISEALGGGLPQKEQELWVTDQLMNLRGFKVDTRLAEAAQGLGERQAASLAEELRELTDEEVDRPSQRARLKEWVNSHGADIPDTKATSIKRALASQDIPEKTQRVLNISISANQTSTAKFNAALRTNDPEDHRVRGTQLYYGASTGRWAGRDLQPHNFKRGFGLYEDDGNCMDDVVHDIYLEDHGLLDMLWGNPMEVLSKATRGLIIPGDGKDLYIADYSAIEARGLAWLAGQDDVLAMFAAGEPVYEDMAVEIYKVPLNAVTWLQRFIGKQAVLGLGYAMGAEKFDDTLWGYDAEQDRDFCKLVVDAYRRKWDKVPVFWDELEGNAMAAVTTGKPQKMGKITWRMRGRFLQAVLPSGRPISYAEPMVTKRKTWRFPAFNLLRGGRPCTLTTTTKASAGTPEAYRRVKAIAAKNDMELDGKAPSACFVNSTLTHMTVKEGKWIRRETYGGMLAENVTQGAARDYMAEAMPRLTPTVYDLLMAVHDELVSEAPKGAGDVEEFEELMGQAPSWAEDWPVVAEGWCGNRYLKL